MLFIWDCWCILLFFFPYSPEIDEHNIALATDDDILDVLEDEDEIPDYKGTFDYYDFWKQKTKNK